MPLEDTEVRTPRMLPGQDFLLEKCAYFFLEYYLFYFVLVESMLHLHVWDWREKQLT